MDENVIKCFICDVPCLAINKHHGSTIASILAMPLTAILEKCLRIIVDAENDYFCVKCTNTIEEYDELVKKCRSIEDDLYEQFQSKAMKCEFDETVIIVDQDKINEILIQTEGPELKSENIEIELDASNDDEEFEEIVKEEYQLYEEPTRLRKRNRQAKNVVESKKNAEVEAKSKKTPSSDKVPVKKRHYKVETVTCDICGRNYQSKGALSVHLVTHVARSPHECKICHKTFTQRGGLTRHMPLHTGEQKYQCDVCGKRFIHTASFNMHKKVHSNERSKKCNICGSEFRSSSHIKRHMRSHTGEKPFECSICGQKFTQRYNLKTHMKTHEKQPKSPLKEYKCLICPEKFTRRSKLNDHLTHAHGAINCSLPLNEAS